MIGAHDNFINTQITVHVMSIAFRNVLLDVVTVNVNRK